MAKKVSKRKLKKAVASNLPIGEHSSYASGRVKKNGKLKKGFKYTEEGSNRIPFQTVAVTPKDQPMRAIKSGTRGSKAKTTVKNKARSL